MKRQQRDLKLEISQTLERLDRLSQTLLDGRDVATEVAAEIGRLQLLLEQTRDRAIALNSEGYKPHFGQALLELPLTQAIGLIDGLHKFSTDIEAALFHDLMDIRNHLISVKNQIVGFVVAA